MEYGSSLQAPLLDAGEVALPFEPRIDEFCTDWLGRPVNQHPGMGGWTCSACILGACAMSCLAQMGVVSNLLVYLVQEWEVANAAAANIVTNFTGTLLLCSFLGAFISDEYLGRLWTTLISLVLTLLSFGLITLSAYAISRGSATAVARSFFMVSLYLMAATLGPSMPSLTSLGADQLTSFEQKEKYFRLLSIFVSLSQLLVTVVVTYIDNMGMWVLGYSLCTVGSAVAFTLVAITLTRCRQYKTSGSPLTRMCQVLVAAWRKRSLTPPKDPTLLYETQGQLSSIPSCASLNTSILRFLDKAALLSATECKEDQCSRWRLCTGTQVEELKSFLRVIPVGVAYLFMFTTNAQVLTLFEEQAVLMNRQVMAWLELPPASLNIFSLVGGLASGTFITTSIGARLLGSCLGCGGQWRRRRGKVTSLQLLGAGMVTCIVAMAIAASVESHRLQAAKHGLLHSVLWLLPQTVCVGVAMNFANASGYDFFYNEVSDGMRTVGTSLLLLFQGAGNYMSSILVSLVNALTTTKGGHPGWIASNLNEGHVDYFYWLLATLLAFTLVVHITYTHNYTYKVATSLK